MREVIAIPMSGADLAELKKMETQVANDPNHEDLIYTEIEFLNGVWMIVNVTWDKRLGKAITEVYNEMNRSDSYWFKPDDITKKGFVDVGGDRVVRFCKVA